MTAAVSSSNTPEQSVMNNPLAGWKLEPGQALDLFKTAVIVAVAGKYFYALKTVTHAVKACVAMRTEENKDRRISLIQNEITEGAKALALASVLSFYYPDIEGIPLSTGTMVYTALIALAFWKPEKCAQSVAWVENTVFPSDKVATYQESRNYMPNQLFEGIWKGSVKLISLFDLPSGEKRQKTE